MLLKSVRLLSCLLLLLVASHALAKRGKAKAVDPDVPTPESLDAEAEQIEEAKHPHARPAPKPVAPAPAPAPPPPPPAPPPEPEEIDAQDSAETTGIECSPAISEVETRRPIPFACAVSRNGVEQVEIRYKAPGHKKWTKLRLQKTTEDYRAEIPCTALNKHGTLKLSILGLNGKGKKLVRIGGVEVRVVEASNQPPPAYPGQEAPQRCYEANECPSALRGSPACPGTTAEVGKSIWGGTCVAAVDCQSGLVCTAGKCERPPRCDADAECGSKGECISGECRYPETENVDPSAGPPRSNWIGVHVAVDSVLLSQGKGVCGALTDDSGSYDCYSHGKLYTGTPNHNYADSTSSGFRLATVRVLLSYERWFKRFALGARVGVAFGGAPKGFNPLHLEARALYLLRNDSLNKPFRPYVGLVAGVARVDAAGKTKVADCPNVSCENLPVSQLAGSGATELKLDVYHKGAGAFVGPTVGFLYALKSNSALSLGLNVLFPDIAFQLSAGYAFGL